METQQGKKKTPKKVWWFKEELDVFESKLVRKLRMKENGDSLFVIYHKLRLLAAKNFGTIKIEDFGESPAEDIAFSIQEKPDNVEIVLDILQSHGLIDFSDDKTELLFPEVVERICSVSDSKERVRRFRERQKQKQADGVTCNGETVTEMLQPLQSVTVTTREREDIREHNITGERKEKFSSLHDEGFIDWAWEEIKSAYPRKDGIEAAKPKFLEIMEQMPEADKHTIKILCVAMTLYGRDHDKKNPDDVGVYKYALGLKNWLNTEYLKWIEEAKQLERISLEAEKRKADNEDSLVFDSESLEKLSAEEKEELVVCGALVMRETDVLVYPKKMHFETREKLVIRGVLPSW